MIVSELLQYSLRWMAFETRANVGVSVLFHARPELCHEASNGALLHMLAHHAL